MKKKIMAIALWVTMGLFFSSPLKSQNITNGKPGMYPSSVIFKTAPPTFREGSVLLLDENGKIDFSSDLVLNHIEKDNLGMQHYRYQQTFGNIPIEHAIYIVHVKEGQVRVQNGKWIKDFPIGLRTTPALGQSVALQHALDFIGANQYKWQLPIEEAFIKREQNNPDATFYPKGELVFYSSEEELSPSTLRIAYKFDIYAHTPISRQIIFVDAQNGKILGKRELIHEMDVPGTAITAYSGSKAITTDMMAPNNYRLRETGRGNGINTYDMRTAGTVYGAAVDFIDTDNHWNNVNDNLDEYATDAHWGAEQAYDYYFTRYNRNSIDNNGFALNSYVHVDLIAKGYPNNVNAFWDGSRMSYGDGDENIPPLTSLDIAGHEITHGLTNFTSNLVYQGESGAMNEGFSDIFGTAIEFFGNPLTANWTIGEDIGIIIRDMSNPNSGNDPDTYLGTHWYAGNNDNGGVHTNSGVLNFWFYLLTNGGSGTNDMETDYNVTGIGIDKAGAIAYRLNTFYLTSIDQYADARILGILAAEDLYGIGSLEAISTENAWCAVGLGPCASTCSSDVAITGLYSEALTESNTWIVTSGQTTISNNADVRLDADPVNGYIELKATDVNDFFLAAPAANGVFVAQTLDGCEELVPLMANNANINGKMGKSSMERGISEVNTEQLVNLYPNPFNQTATLAYKVATDDTFVTIGIYKQDGRQIDQLMFQKMHNRGTYRAEVDGRKMQNGLYIYRVQIGSKTIHGKMILQR